MDRLAEIATLLQDPASISAEQLAELEAELVQIYDDLRGKSLDDQTVADLKAASELIKGVRTEQASRAEAEEALRAQLEELDREIHPGEDAEAIVLDDEPTPDDGEEEVETVAETVEEDEEKKKEKVPVTASGRGQITYPTPLTLASIGTSGGSPDQAIEVISEATLAAGHTKLYQEIDCGSELNVKVEAITKRVRFGNLNAIVQPERVAEIIDLTDVMFARVAELRLLTLMNAGSLQVSEQQDVGFSRDIFVYIRRAVSALRYRHRLDGQAFTAQIPRWGLDAFLSDVELGAYPTGAGAIKDEDSVTAYLARAGVRVVWTDESLVTPFAQEVTSTRLDLYPTQIKYLLYPEGTWIHGDAGTIDLGIVRDSALNAVNKYETFFESFETVAKMGAESYAITQTFCVNGASAGTIAPNDICDGGS